MGIIYMVITHIIIIFYVEKKGHQGKEVFFPADAKLTFKFKLME